MTPQKEFLAQKIQQDIEFSIENELNKLKNKYQKYSTIQSYLTDQAKPTKELFPSEICDQNITIAFQNENVLTARYILMYYKFVETNEKATVSACPLTNLIINQQNSFYKKYLKLTSKTYQKRYLADIGLISKIKNQKYFRNLANFTFYTNKQKIKSLHEKRGNYKWMQRNHDYIQWMFPNHYQSSFNYDSQAMSYLEVTFFQKYQSLGLKILYSIEMFLDFLGLSLTPKYIIEIIDEKRLSQALMRYTHNHLRIRRFLACLLITGFQPIALSLISFLRQLIQKQKYHQLQLIFKYQWQIYDSQKNLQMALKMCFHPEQNFPKDNPILQKVYNSRISKILNNIYKKNDSETVQVEADLASLQSE